MSHHKEHYPEPRPVQPHSFENVTDLGSYAAQALFESMFTDHKPRIDTCRPHPYTSRKAPKEGEHDGR